MRKVVLSMTMSLDGFTAGPNDEMDWLPPFGDEELWKDMHQGMWDQLRVTDTLILGLKTYQIWENYWPAAGANPASTKNDIEFSRYAEETQKIVFSTTLEKAGWKNSRLVKGNIAEEVARLKQQPGKDLLIAGGAGIAQTFMRLGLIDEYKLLVQPVMIGSGKPLFKGLNTRIKLRLLASTMLRPGVVLLDYEPRKPG